TASPFHSPSRIVPASLMPWTSPTASPLGGSSSSPSPLLSQNVGVRLKDPCAKPARTLPSPETTEARLPPFASGSSSTMPVAFVHRKPRPSQPSQESPTATAPSPDSSYPLLRLGQVFAFG